MERQGEGLKQYDVLDCVRIATEGKERGLVLSKVIQPSESILLLPSRSLLNVLNLHKVLEKGILPSSETPSHSYHWRKDENNSEKNNDPKLPLTSVQALTLALASWKARRGRASPEDSHLDTILSSFPESYPTFPLVWQALSQGNESVSQMYRSLLDALPSHVIQLCNKVQERFHKDFRAINLANTIKDHHLKLNLSDLTWAWCSVNSRCVYVPLGLKPHQDNFTLAPLLDMANHTVDKTLECKVKWTSTGGLQLSAPAKTYRPQGLSIGQEIMITYGPHSNGTLLSEYGFLLPSCFSPASQTLWQGNPYAEVNVDDIIQSELSKQGNLGRQKTDLLEEYGYNGDYTIHPFPSPTHPSHRLVIALRLFAIPLTAVSYQNGTKKQKVNHGASDLEAWKEMLFGEREIVSPENEEAVHNILVRICDYIEISCDEKKTALLALQRSVDVEDGHLQELKASLEIVMNLVEEERIISQMMRDAIQSGSTEW